MRKDYLYWIWLSLCYGPGNGGYVEVLEKFEDPYAAYIADEQTIRERIRDPQAVARLLRKDISEAHRIYDFCATRGVSILTYGDIAYPARLKTIQNPPILLYYIGTLPAFNRKLCIAVVGTRRMSEYGKKMAYKISYELAAAGTVIVSGMALGCDAVAAGGAIAAGGETVALLGSGIDVVYPRQHLKLMEIIAENGAVMTEYPPGTKPSGYHFPVRNRIISGLCQGTLAVEGNRRSGAMLTVGHALKQGRKIFAVPGNVGEANAEGTNDLLREGADMVLEAGDVLDAFAVPYREVIDVSRLSEARKHSDLDEGTLLRMGICSRLQDLPVDEPTGYAYSAPLIRKTNAGPSAPKPPAGGDLSPKTKSTGEKRETPPPDGAQKPGPARQGDDSAEILASLSERERKIFSEMPLDRAVAVDVLTGAGFPIGDVMTALTILEIRGLVTSLPGGLYLRK